MLQDQQTIIDKHNIFIKRVIKSQTVWALESEDGFAMSPSNEFEETSAIPFWSDEAYAKSAAQDEWANYHPKSITLASFLENWLIGMYNDGDLVGTNWDMNMFGKETEPIDLAIELIDSLMNAGTGLNLKKLTDLPSFREFIKTQYDK